MPEGSNELKQRLDGIRYILMAHHAAGKRLPNAAKGSERETLVREFLARVFPSPFRFGTGAIIDSDGRKSGQIDVVAEFPFFPSFPTPGAQERLYLAESVSFALEVKSDLTAQWDEVEKTAEAILPLRRKWNGHVGFEQGRLQLANASTSRIPFVAIGFIGSKKVETLEKRLRDTPECLRPDGALVLESGTYVCFLQGSRGTDTAGLFAFCVDAARFATNVLTAHPNFDDYFHADVAPAAEPAVGRSGG
jgi:hypothetical protein